MDLGDVLGDVEKRAFVAEYYGRLPHSGRSSAELVEMGGWETLAGIATQPEADVMVVRENRRYEGPAPETADDYRGLLEAGHTLLVRHAERRHAGLAALAEGIERDLGAAVNVHMYATPPGQFGFGWHYDAEEVFIVQCTGRKTYALRKNTVNPWPLEETLPADMRYEREIMPLMQCTLAGGDWLYIPAGYWHRGAAETGAAAAEPAGGKPAEAAAEPAGGKPAEAAASDGGGEPAASEAVSEAAAGEAFSEPAISLAIGALAPAAIGLVDLLRARLADSLPWRQRLPVVGQAAALSDEERLSHYRALAGVLGPELRRMAEDEGLMADLLAQAAELRPETR